jgi:hypothetical protein
MVGIVMLLTPGPGLLTIVAGLAVLSTEYAWARRALLRARERSVRTVQIVQDIRRRSQEPEP